MYQRGYGEIKMTDSSTHLMHVIVSNLEIVDAVAFTRKDRVNNKGRWTKQPFVHLTDGNSHFHVSDKHIMHKLLNNLNKDSMYFNAYLQFIDEFPLETILGEALIDGKDLVLKCWVTKQEDSDIYDILGFSEIKVIEWELLSFTINEITEYLKQKGFAGRIAIEEYDFGEGKSSSLTGTYVKGNSIISIIVHNNNPIIRARYINPCDSAMILLDTHVLKGSLSTIEVKKLYSIIDILVMQLDNLNICVMPFMEAQKLMTTKHIRKFRDKSKIESENYDKIINCFRSF